MWLTVSKIVRVIRQPRGNMLLIGIGGSGRQSLTRLSAHICTYDTFQIEVSKNYRKMEFREGNSSLCTLSTLGFWNLSVPLKSCSEWKCKYWILPQWSYEQPKTHSEYRLDGAHQWTTGSLASSTLMCAFFVSFAHISTRLNCDFSALGHLTWNGLPLLLCLLPRTLSLMLFPRLKSVVFSRAWWSCESSE